MNRVLIICPPTIDGTGGAQCMNRNIESIKTINGSENTYVYNVISKKTIGLKNVFKRLINIIHGYYSGLDSLQEQTIIDNIKEHNINVVYIDRSIYGKIAKTVKKYNSNIKIYTFFHNCELEYMFNSVIETKRIVELYNLILIYRNENIACKYSDEIIVLNDRDKKAISKYYRRNAKYIIPITFKPWYEPNCTNLSVSHPYKALFVGSYFYGNTLGLKWFCLYVLPHIDIHLTIVGSGMEKLASEVNQSEKLTIQGKVPDLKPYYEEADFVILPILSGGGMKVKTGESLMFGKYIIGSPEALTGYDVDNSTATICSSVQDFINAINTLKLTSKFNKASRDLFDKKYSFNNSLELFKKVFKTHD